MARHRRTSAYEPPLELEFRPDDWLPDVSPYWTWLMARLSGRVHIAIPGRNRPIIWHLTGRVIWDSSKLFAATSRSR